MTLTEALEVAERVERSSDWVVTAIGRFMMPTDLVQADGDGTLGKHPWMVAIMSRHDIATFTKITSLENWFDWQVSDRATKRPKSETKPPVRETKAAKNESNAAQAAPAGMLF
jgi:hypothetical protein